MSVKVRYGLAAGALLLMSTSVASAQTPGATASIKTPGGEVVGQATFSAASGGVLLKAEVRNLPPGDHGIHVHAVGKCDAPDFMTAAGHFNPHGKKHGLQSAEGAHAGDMPNLKVGPNGSGTFEFLLKDVTLDSGAGSLFGPDGTALVIHAGPDDEKSDPAGNSGARIACGVIAKAGAAQAAPAAQPSPVAAPAVQPSPAAKPAAPAQAPAAAKPAAPAAAAPVASPSALPRTGVAGVPIDASVPAALAGVGALLGGLALWRRRR